MKSLQYITEKLKVNTGYMKWLKPVFTKFKGSPWEDVKVEAEPYKKDSHKVDIKLLGIDPSSNTNIELMIHEKGGDSTINILSGLNGEKNVETTVPTKIMQKEIQSILSQMISKYIKKRSK